MDNFQTLKGVKTVMDSRNILKDDIALNTEMLEQREGLRKKTFHIEEAIIKELQIEVRSLNDKIKGMCIKAELNLKECGFVEEQRKEIGFRACINDRLADIENSIQNFTTSEKNEPTSVPLLSIPKLQCATFSGINPSKFEYKNFIAQFKNCTDSIDSGKARLALLRGYLSDYALQLVSHLTLEDGNYSVAVDLLTKEFLDVPFIISEIFRQIISTSPQYDPEFLSVRQYLAEVRADLSELRTSYLIDFFEDNSPGFLLVSHIIYEKLPVALRREINHRVGTSYPSLTQIFENYNEAVRALSRDKKHFRFTENPSKNDKGHVKAYEKKNGDAALQNFTTSSSGAYCKLCTSRGHAMLKCTKFSSYEARVERCKQLKLCTGCSSFKHKSENCPGLQSKSPLSCSICTSRTHITPLCNTPKRVISLFSHVYENEIILPIVAISLNYGSEKATVNCLLDTGSQRSYFSKKILKELKYPEENSDPTDYQMKTYSGVSMKKFEQVVLSVTVGKGKQLPVPVLIDDGFSIQFEFASFGQVKSNLNELRCRLAFSDENQGDSITIQGILGVDIFQFMEGSRIVKCMNGQAWDLPQGIAPFGNVQQFLYPHQVSPVRSGTTRTIVNYHTTISKYAYCPERQLNSILEPKSSYPDPFPDVFETSNVERNLEKMFAVDSAATYHDEELIGDYDRSKIENFRESIEFRNNSYFVDLPWHEDKIGSVPSNYQVALKVLDRTMLSLEKRDLDKTYTDIFLQQENEGIIERIEVAPQEFYKYIWIPHRPVFKSDQQVTTKIRPVFNCSLRTGGGYSLNEACYPGVNMMNNMLELLLLFVTNKYVLLGDIRKAFLMIRLKSVEDKNRFCFFVKDGDKLLCFRYCTLIFGFNASPFILNYVLKHHVSRFPNDACTEMLKDRFYVDNLCMTSNSSEEIISLYKNAVPRLQAGNFQLRSCNSNYKPLRDIIAEDDRIVQHGCEYEKVLGYKYHPELDTISIANTIVQRNILSKRDILAQTAKVFDPLSLCAPVTIKAKILLRRLWLLKLSWDEKVPTDIMTTWSNLAEDLSGLSDLFFTRQAMDTDSQLRLYLFCDASPQAYGFVVYGVQNGKSHIIFSKVKVAPMKTKTLPMMELLAVYIAFKALTMLLKSFSGVKIEDVFVSVDAQVVLSWLLTENIKAKSLYTRNRIKDIREMKEKLSKEFGVDIHYKYVPSANNPADLLSRGITLEKFKQGLDYWTYGPAWLVEQPEKWPTGTLSCLSPENKCHVESVFHNTLSEAVREPLIPFDRFSDFNKLCRSTAFVFQFVHRCRQVKEQSDQKQTATNYLIKMMQLQSFQKEIAYLKDPLNREIPSLVRNLNVFIDSDGILRVDGRIANSTRYDYNLVYPILIAKHHPLTKLLIMDSHHRCRHLGIGTTVTKLRLSGYWVPQARQSVKTVISNCNTCRKFNSLAFKYPKLTNLPKHRVRLINPFQHTGIDYTGHIWVQRDGKSHKMYLLIFTCMNVRAIHIELVPDMSTQAFIQAVIRFSNIYGVPSHIYSDNARSFNAALGGDVIKHHINSNEFCNSDSSSGIKHIKIPLYSPWVGSTWERMIRVIKSCLFKTLGRSKIGYFNLLTLLSDIQRAVNSRPLTYRCSTDVDLLPLTPNCFVHPNINCELSFQSDTPSLVETEPITRSLLVSTLEGREELMSKFKEMWHDEYLLSLRESCKDLHEIEFHNKINVNDVILVKNPAKSRPFWKLGRVIELFSGNDGKVRSARIKRGDGSVETHSLKHLYPLELSLTHNHFPDTPAEEESDELASPPIEDCREPSEHSEELANYRPKRIKKSTSNPEYIYY